tara:strand:+ start:424 stop:858 length:435 start_codon:yes stop_codon:yes gene_type:complete
MSTLTDNENIAVMAYIAIGFNQEDEVIVNMEALERREQFFAEIPDDAFDHFGLDDPDTSFSLSHSYNANCPRCFTRTTTFDPNDRLIQCGDCMEFAATTMQRIRRGHVLRQKMKRLQKSELMHRWFTGGGVNGSDLSWNIMKYI